MEKEYAAILAMITYARLDFERIGDPLMAEWMSLMEHITRARIVYLRDVSIGQAEYSEPAP
jgi:hypothetical protein